MDEQLEVSVSLQFEFFFSCQLICKTINVIFVQYKLIFHNLTSGFSHDDLIEPIAVAVNNNDEVLIADNGVGSILVFESCGKLKKKIGVKGKNKGEFKELSSVCIGPAGEIIVADTRIIVFSPSGEFIREVGGVGGGAGARGRFCGVSVDRQGHLLAARMEKTKSYIQVSHFSLISHTSYSHVLLLVAKQKRGICSEQMGPDLRFFVFRERFCRADLGLDN